MRYSDNLLKRYISLDVDPQLIASQLTLKTCEVEEMHIRNIPDEVVIGKVTSVNPHPNADKLLICQLDCGTKGIYQICTGGENVIAESYVPVALPGCYLPAINLTIEPREMRGEESNGMICSKQELGIPEDLDEHRIRTLQYQTGTDLTTVPQMPDMEDISDDDLGRALSDKYPWLENWMADVENKTITHRPDLFGHFGMSIELDTIFPGEASFSNGKKYMQQIKENAIFETLENATKSKRTITVQTDRVLTYTLLEIDNIVVQKSDFLLRTHLYDLGLQPKNNRVDLSNVFMYLTGQPVHFFDAKKVIGDIIIRQAKKGEKFVDLFGKEHQLIEEDLVIADKEKILALAGVIGSESSGIDETTTDILVEIANFDPIAVRKTGTRLSLRTDAELRFEKQINPLYSLHATTMFLDELQYFSKSLGSYQLGGMSRRSSASAQIQVIKKIPLDTLHVEQVLFGNDSNNGHVTITDEKVVSILQALGCTINEEREVTIPARRGPDDITHEADLIEEIARIYGFDNIAPQRYVDESTFVPFNQTLTQHRLVEKLLVDTYGCDQIETYPWIDQRRIDLLKLSTNNLYSMENPLTPEQRYLRNTLLRSLLEAVEKNAPFFEQMKVFDIGKVRELGTEYPEQDFLGIAYRDKATTNRQESGLLQVKGVITTLISTLGCRGALTILPTQNPLFHPKQQATLSLDGQTVGSLQVVHPYLLSQGKFPANGNVVLAEISLSALLHKHEHTKVTSPKYETLQDQIVRRDLNFVIDHEMNYEIVVQAVQAVKEITDVEVFDLYAGSRLSEGKKSIGLRVKLVGDGTLQSQQINDIVQQAITAVEGKGGELRK